jgi:rhamnosyltransferase subunit B
VSRIVLTPVGSAGDVNPFVWIGRAMKARGHEVILVASAPFADAAARVGIGFVAAGTPDDYERVTNNPELWHPRKGLQVVLSTVAQHLRGHYELIETLYEPGRTVLIGHSLSFATRVFEETHRVPAATVHLAPSIFRSTIEPPETPMGPALRALPHWLQRALWRALDRFMIDPLIARPLNDWRTELGLAPISRVFQDWMHSPQRVLGLFPEWFAARQPDWPPQVRLTGFVLDQGAGGLALDPSIDEFLGRGSPPLVFTPGSANRHAAAFMRAAVGASSRLGVRAMLVTPYREHVPADLPANAIGTCAQGFAAGVPQLVMPMGFDQPDNAARIARLGVGAWLTPARFTADRVARALEQLLTSTSVPHICRDLADRMRDDDSLGTVCEEIEALGSRLYV